MKARFDRTFYVPDGAEEIQGPGGINAVAYLYRFGPDKSKVGAMLFSGKRSKPDWHHSFRDEVGARKYIADGFACVADSERRRAEWKAARLAEKCYTVADVYRKARTGDGYISAADAAICLRAVLAAKWPGTAFSVRSDGSLNVSWTDGPAYRDVDAVASQYSFHGFDGMIDLRYSISRWLAPDGRMSLAHSTGSQCSMGCDPEAIGSPNDPQAVEVRGGADFVFCRREISPGVKWELTQRVCRKYGLPVPPNDEKLDYALNTTRLADSHVYLSELIHKAANGVED